MAHLERYMEVCVHRSGGRTANPGEACFRHKALVQPERTQSHAHGTRNPLNRLEVGQFLDLLPSILFVPKAHILMEPVLPE